MNDEALMDDVELGMILCEFSMSDEDAMQEMIEAGLMTESQAALMLLCDSNDEPLPKDLEPFDLMVLLWAAIPPSQSHH